jgi:hypothetical protein
MPYKRTRGNAKRRASGGKKARAAPKRRLSSLHYSPKYDHTLPPTPYKDRKYGNLRGSFRNRAVPRGKHGKAAVVDAATGAAGGFRVGKAKSMGTILERRKKQILDIMADARFPVIKDHKLLSRDQIDWSSGIQSCNGYKVGYDTQEIEDMLVQANSASNVGTAALIPTSGTLEPNKRMDIYSKTTKMNFKNTCSHTVYMEVHPYECTTLHSFPMYTSFVRSLTQDNMLQNAALFGTEESIFAIGKRPDFQMAELNVRWKKVTGGIYKCALEPGQETSYTYVQRGGRFDQHRFNVQQGSQTSPVDAQYLPGLSAEILVFCRAEMVADSLDADVTYGSGHIAVNSEVIRSWAAVPYLKPIQTSFENQWGTVVEANELDINQYAANNDPYEEQV